MTRTETISSGDAVLMMADTQPAGCVLMPGFAWTPLWVSDGDPYGGWLWPYRDRFYPVPGPGDRYWARARKASRRHQPGDPRMWFWEVLFGEVAADVDDIWDEPAAGRYWHAIEGVWLRCVEVGEGRASTLHEAQTLCQDAADEHHLGPEIAWWAHAERALQACGSDMRQAAQ